MFVNSTPERYYRPLATPPHLVCSWTSLISSWYHLLKLYPLFPISAEHSSSRCFWALLWVFLVYLPSNGIFRLCYIYLVNLSINLIFYVFDFSRTWESNLKEENELSKLRLFWYLREKSCVNVWISGEIVLP